MRDLEIEVTESAGVRVLKCGGKIDYDTYRDLKEKISSALNEKKFNIVVDLENVNYVSTAGWGVVLGHVKEAREHGGDIKLTGMKTEVRKSFELLELGNFVTDCVNTDQAIKIFRAN